MPKDKTHDLINSPHKVAINPKDFAPNAVMDSQIMAMINPDSKHRTKHGQEK